jgi:glycine/D-amino acid oxidase-like deaminating enzyme/nitrite reductase/ring-hydroxylating ferredoxin subunit
MIPLAGKPISYWIDSTPSQNFAPLTHDLTVDVAIVGGGIAGLTTALLLKRAGKTVAVLESKQVAAGVSGHTTAKITSLHQLIYADLIKEIGEDKARIYGESNQAAIEQVAAFVAEENIDCDFSRQSAYSFAETDSELEQVKSEVEAAVKLGLPATFVRETSLPFAISGAVKFENQAQFHVRKYLLALANRIAGDGSYVFEQTQVVDVEEGTPCRVSTVRGTVKATDVIITTHSPILDQGLFFAKVSAKRSYIIGVPIDLAHAPHGMFIGVGQEYHSIRTTPTDDGLLLLIGGGGHRVGEVTDTETKYQKLEAYARSRFGINTVRYRWSTQDLIPFDKLPYIGKLTPFNQHIFVATGFNLWGMSKGTLAGMILADTVLGFANPWAKLYDSIRFAPLLTPGSVQQNGGTTIHWIVDRLKGLFDSSLADLKPGEAKLLTLDGEKIAAHRDEQGELHAVSAVCTHLGCIVNWNSAEQSWDCPCHGARFDIDGEVLQTPAIKNLQPYLGKPEF